MKKENQKYTSNASEHEGWKFSISSQSNIQSADELFARSDNKFSLHLHDLPIAGHETKVQFKFIISPLMRRDGAIKHTREPLLFVMRSHAQANCA